MKVLLIDHQNKIDSKIENDDFKNLGILKQKLTNQNSAIAILAPEDLISGSRKKELHQITYDDFSPDFRSCFNFSKTVVFKANQESKVLKNRLSEEQTIEKLKALNLDFGTLTFA